MVQHVADWILALHGWPALAVIFVLPALESSAFLGFVFPGEVAVLLGGVLAFNHRVPLGAAMAAAILGAAVGDTIGYAVGKRFGRRLLYGTVGRLVRPDHLRRAERYLATKGGRAVFFGRFTAALRVLVPGLAGMAGMEYRTFALFNVAGATVWGTGFTLLGYAAGDSWRHVEHEVRRAGLLMGVLAALLLAIAFAARWVARHRDRVEAWARSQLERPSFVFVRRRYERQLGFLARRVRPQGVFGLALTVELATLVALAWGMAVVVQDVLADAEHRRLDRPVLDLVVRHRTGWLDTADKIVTAAGSKTILIPLVLIVSAVYVVRRRDRGRWEAPVLLASALAGAWLASESLKALVHKPRPPAVFHLTHVSGYGFPSGHATQAAAVYGILGIVLARSLGRWPQRVMAVAATFVVTLLVGLSRVYLGVHWLTDVLGGWALGWAWALVLLAAGQVILRRPDLASEPEPEEAGPRTARRGSRPPRRPAPAGGRRASA
ncbi:MAG TPA: bifunctional DedA family/phosphatase PAP2 family protein [Acidimicrobiales bacterium]|nr:bifunctional DedA family/phosphatase PAP2 family protein [Acidimicrobiales bacterium]